MSWEMSGLFGCAGIVAAWGMELGTAKDLLPVLQETANRHATNSARPPSSNSLSLRRSSESARVWSHQRHFGEPLGPRRSTAVDGIEFVVLQ